MNKLVISKRSGEEIVCWKVNCKGLTPNTVLEKDPGITLIIKIEGQKKIWMRESDTVYSILNPGKNKKLIGGNKEYSEAFICAIDQSSEFAAEWGLGGPTAMPCRDEEFGVDCTAIANGKYFYKVENFFAFVESIPFNSDGAVSRNDIREFLRMETTGIIKNFLASKVASLGVLEAQKKMAMFADEIKSQINSHLEAKGLTVHTFVISALDFDNNHKARRGIINSKKIDQAENKLNNDMARDNIDVRAKAVKEVEVPLYEAQHKMARDVISREEVKVNSEEKKPVCYVTCSRCGEKNPEGTNYCSKCGEKISK